MLPVCAKSHSPKHHRDGRSPMNYSRAIFRFVSATLNASSSNGCKRLRRCQLNFRSEIAFTEAPSRWPQPNELFARDFSVCQRDVEREFKQWLQASPSVSAEFSSARELAAYVDRKSTRLN